MQKCDDDDDDDDDGDDDNDDDDRHLGGLGLAFSNFNLTNLQIV